MGVGSLIMIAVWSGCVSMRYCPELHRLPHHPLAPALAVFCGRRPRRGGTPSKSESTAIRSTRPAAGAWRRLHGCTRLVKDKADGCAAVPRLLLSGGRVAQE